jgi:hypothetical protein
VAGQWRKSQYCTKPLHYKAFDFVPVAPVIVMMLESTCLYLGKTRTTWLHEP